MTLSANITSYSSFCSSTNSSLSGTKSPWKKYYVRMTLPFLTGFKWHLTFMSQASKFSNVFFTNEQWMDWLARSVFQHLPSRMIHYLGRHWCLVFLVSLVRRWVRSTVSLRREIFPLLLNPLPCSFGCFFVQLRSTYRQCLFLQCSGVWISVQCGGSNDLHYSQCQEHLDSWTTLLWRPLSVHRLDWDYGNHSNDCNSHG